MKSINWDKLGMLIVTGALCLGAKAMDWDDAASVLCGSFAALLVPYMPLRKTPKP